MSIAGVRTVFGAVQFLVLFIVYVAALTAMSVVRAGRASRRWIVRALTGSGSDGSPRRTLATDATESPYPAGDRESVEESVSP
ncbi:hypothetical protein [Halorubrum laminariae]|uniref:Uncharacterized protein n=1 Tax=Halorubrum laminariae TaxID=1433523 RepID=A0ABD6C0H8_9EURY|nr:hypothetical protein [Halorubrum laminariae]